MSDGKKLAPEEYEPGRCSLGIVVNLNWIFGDVLGYICARKDFRVEKNFCKDGYVLMKDMAKLLPDVDQKDGLIRLLKEFQVILSISSIHKTCMYFLARK